MDVAEAYHRRAEALERFARWQRANRLWPSPQAALSGVGLLYDLLPAAARRRPVDTVGVRRLHRALSVLSTSAS